MKPGLIHLQLNQHQRRQIRVLSISNELISNDNDVLTINGIIQLLDIAFTDGCSIGLSALSALLGNESAESVLCTRRDKH